MMSEAFLHVVSLSSLEQNLFFIIISSLIFHKLLHSLGSKTLSAFFELVGGMGM